MKYSGLIFFLFVIMFIQTVAGEENCDLLIQTSSETFFENLIIDEYQETIISDAPDANVTITRIFRNPTNVTKASIFRVILPMYEEASKFKDVGFVLGNMTFPVEIETINNTTFWITPEKCRKISGYSHTTHGWTYTAINHQKKEGDSWHFINRIRSPNNQVQLNSLTHVLKIKKTGFFKEIYRLQVIDSIPPFDGTYENEDYYTFVWYYSPPTY